MYIVETTKDASETREGIWKEPWNEYWEALLIFDNVVYDLGRYGNAAEAGIAFAKALMTFRENMSEAPRVTASHQLNAAGVGSDSAVRPSRGAVGLYD